MHKRTQSQEESCLGNEEWFDARPPNGLPLSCAAPIDRESADVYRLSKCERSRGRTAASATAACWAAAPIDCRTEACGSCADTIAATALGGSTLTVPHPAPRAFVWMRLETALIQTTVSTTGLHPTLDSFDPNSTVFVSQSTRETRSRTRQLYD